MPTLSSSSPDVRSPLNYSAPETGAERKNEEEPWTNLGLPESSEKETQAGGIQTDPGKILQARIKEEIILPKGEDWWWGIAENTAISQPFFR